MKILHELEATVTNIYVDEGEIDCEFDNGITLTIPRKKFRIKNIKYAMPVRYCIIEENGKKIDILLEKILTEAEKAEIRFKNKDVLELLKKIKE